MAIIVRQVALLDRKTGLSLPPPSSLIGMDRHTQEPNISKQMIRQRPEVLECSLVTGMDADYQQGGGTGHGSLPEIPPRPADPHRRRHQRALQLQAQPRCYPALSYPEHLRS